MALIDLDKMLEKIKSSQWALAEIDFDAPGADMITAEQWPKLKEFMADLMWIEHIGARGFAALAKKAPNDTLKEIYTYFHAEEQRHANVEMALMRRWGMLDGDKIPEPNINIRLAIELLDRYSDDMPLSALGSVIPMLEVALDGALLKFLLDEVKDPVCHQAFAKINDDESRHLGVDFHVLEMMGHGKNHRLMIEFLGSILSPKMIIGTMIYFPLLNRVRDKVVGMGLKEERLYEAMRKYKQIGSRSEAGARNPWFQFFSMHGQWVMNRKNHLYHVPVDALVTLSNYIPHSMLPPMPTWVKQLTWKPTA
jgi:hypothetical protein